MNQTKVPPSPRSVRRPDVRAMYICLEMLEAMGVKRELMSRAWGVSRQYVADVLRRGRASREKAKELRK